MRDGDTQDDTARVKGRCCSEVRSNRTALEYLEKREFASARRNAYTTRETWLYR